LWLFIALDRFLSLKLIKGEVKVDHLGNGAGKTDVSRL